MTVDNTFMIKKLQRLEEMLVAFSQFTRMPFVECDEETFDDQIHVFADATKIQEFAKSFLEDKILLAGVKVPVEQKKSFLNSLYSIGVNAVMFHDGDSITRIQLQDLIRQPDFENLLKEKIPVMNPSLQLSALYFIQELRRPVQHDQVQLHDMEEEMIRDIAKSRFIMGLEVEKKEGDSKEKIRIPFVKDKDENILQPIFSDFAEFQKHYKQKALKMKLAPLTLAQLSSYLIEDSKGFVLNPSGFNLPLSKDQINMITDNFQDLIPEN